MKKKKPKQVTQVTVSVERTYNDKQLAYVELSPAQETCLKELFQILYDAGRIEDSAIFDRSDAPSEPLHGLPALLTYLQKEYDIPADVLKAVNEGKTSYDFRIPSPDDDE